MIIRNSYINGRYTESSSSFFVIQNSNVTIINSTFTNNSIEFNSTQPTLLNASIHSHIALHNCLVSGNRGYVSIIQVTNQSFIHLINSEISYNRISNENNHKRSIFNFEHSFVSAINCTFTHNQLVSPTNTNDGVLSIIFISRICNEGGYKYSIVNFENSFVSAVNCTFTHNQLVSPANSAVVSIIFISRIFLESCTFTNNQGATISAIAKSTGKINVTNCYFAENNYTEMDKATLDLTTLDPNFSRTIF